MFTETAPSPVSFRAAVFCAVFGSFISVPVHAQAHPADRDTVAANGEIILINEIPGISRIQVNKGTDFFPCTVIIDSISVMCGIQKELYDGKIRQVCFHGEKGVEKRKHVMPGSPFQKGKNREVTVGTGSHIHVEVVPEEIAFPVGIPSPVAVGLGIVAFTVTGRTVLFLTVTDTFFPLLRGSTDGGAVTGKCQVARVDESPVDGLVQELLAVKPENERKRSDGFQVPAFQEGKKPGSDAGRITGSLLSFLFPLWRFHSGKPVFRGEIIRIPLPHAGKEIIKGTDTRGIAERKAAEDGIKRVFLKHTAPGGDGSYFQL